MRTARPAFLDPVETCISAPFGRRPSAMPAPVASVDLAHALIDTVGRLIDAHPGRRVTVEFSGGCDSSLVLAAAATACRVRGTPPPVPITLRYPDLPETDESAYQDAMVQSLGLSEWIRLDLHDESDMLGPRAQAILVEHGPVFPAALLGRAPSYRAAAGSILLNGEGGDEVLGPRRLAPLFLAMRELRRDRRLSRGSLGEIAALLRPDRATASRVQQVIDAAPWLSPEARRLLEPKLRAHLAPEPFDLERAFRNHLQRKLVHQIQQSMRWFGELHDAVVVSPLLDPAFVASIPRHARLRDLRDRTTVLERHFAGLLPRPLRARRSKVAFNGAFFGPFTRDFARRWDGTGVDAGLVDARVLREQWLGVQPSGMTMALLQQAWLASDTSSAAKL